MPISCVFDTRLMLERSLFLVWISCLAPEYCQKEACFLWEYPVWPLINVPPCFDFPFLLCWLVLGFKIAFFFFVFQQQNVFMAWWGNMEINLYCQQNPCSFVVNFRDLVCITSGTYTAANSNLHKMSRDIFFLFDLLACLSGLFYLIFFSFVAYGNNLLADRECLLWL